MAAESLSVDTVEFIEHRGQRVMLIVNWNHTPETIMAAIDHVAAEIAKEPDRSVRAVLDVTGGSANAKGTAYWETKLALFDQKVLKAAVASTGMVRLVTSAIVMTARVTGMELADRVKIFGDRQAALDWVSEA